MAPFVFGPGARRWPSVFVSLVLFFAAHCTATAQSYAHFEARHTHSIRLTPDGKLLLALNTPDSRLSVFDVSDSTNSEPTLIAEIPVSLEPISVCARTNDEVWVVSELGDSISVVSLSQRLVIDTLRVPDEPADVVFAQGKAYVTCARNGLVRVFDAVTRAELPSITLEGNYPRALAVNAAGTKVYVAFQLSGNNTTIIPKNLVTPAERLQPTNVALPQAPQTSLIVSASDPRVNYTVLDRDIAEIDTATGTVARYISGAGTNLFDLAVHPGTGDIWVANTNARNLIRFEPSLRGHVADHRLTKVALLDGAATIFDLNPGLNYFILPNNTGLTTSVAQPTGIAITADGTHAWVAGFGSDRVAKVATATGALVTRVNLRPAGVTTRGMRGPRSLVLREASERLYVLNKLANTIAVISTSSGTLLGEFPTGSHDPMPTAVKEGRGFLFDARLSGNGVSSCATCHLDADLDGLAWDLGDRGGTMTIVQGKNLSVHDETLRNRSMHPMKGPMVTQTLRGMQNGAPFHWRGDKPTLQSFNSTFDKLMGGSELSPADIDAMAAYLLTLKHHPNPNLNRDGSLPVTFMGGNLARGKQLYDNELNHCIVCHSLPPNLTRDPLLPPLPNPDNNIDLPGEVGSVQPVKNPSLATFYQRMKFNPVAGQSSISGFGLLHDGLGFEMPKGHPYILDQLETAEDFADLTAFILCFATGTSPSIGDSRTVTPANAADTAVLSDIARLESQAVAQSSELVVRGTIGDQLRSFLFDTTTQLYVADGATQPPVSRATLLGSLNPGNAITFLGVPPGYGARMGRDRDANGTLDADEPLPSLGISPLAGTNVRLQWPNPANGWLLQSAPAVGGPWEQITRPRTRTGGSQWLDESTTLPAAFFRLLRTW